MSKKRIAATSLIIFFSVVGLIGGWLYYSKILTVNYLIPGVPYNGIYNLYFQKVRPSKISSVLDILGYWGDKRFAISDLRQKFLSNELATSTSMLSRMLESKSEIQNFFTENGYETPGWLSVDPANVIKEIKQFVNSKKRVPVIVLAKRDLDEKNNIFLFNFQVVIGVFDSSQKIIVQDHYYGNNYEISYGDFTKMFQEAGTDILAVWPTGELKESIEGPNYNITYPQRLESMDKAGPLLATKNLQASILWERGARDQSIAVYKEFFSDPNFKYLPPAFQIAQLTDFARLYIDLNQPDEAIKIFNEQVLPLNKNLSQMSQGWFGIFSDEFSVPYYILSLAYLEKGENDLALNSYKKMKLIRASSCEMISRNCYNLKPIDELEKEILTEE